MEANRGIILFDGVCNLCNHAVDFVIKRDRKNYYYFTSIQSEKGKELIQAYDIAHDVDSMIVIEDKQAYTHDKAALKIVPKLGIGWRIFLLAYLIPPKLRHKLYMWVAKNRYRFFGKKESCRLPSKEERKQFL